MKKIILLLTILLVGAISYFFYKQNSDLQGNPVQYNEVVNHSESLPLVASAAIIEKQNLTTMLETGILTRAGIVKSTRLDAVKGIEQYSLQLDGKSTGILTVSPIELVKGFQIDHKQILLIAYDQGGNQCSRKYQILTMDESVQISKPFGSCLPLSGINEESHEIILTMPQNNPYLGDDVTVSYRYADGNVTLLNKTKPDQLQQKYKALTATQILKIAAIDGCYQDGVMLDDNSCENGLKYCTMFKNIPKQAKNLDYKFLSDFCTQP